MKMFLLKVRSNLKTITYLARNWWKLRSVIDWYGRSGCYLSPEKLNRLELRIMKLENRKIDKEYVMELLCSQAFIKAQEEYEAGITKNILDGIRKK